MKTLFGHKFQKFDVNLIGAETTSIATDLQLPITDFQFSIFNGRPDSIQRTLKIENREFVIGH
jgi:hypothetical protein